MYICVYILYMFDIEFVSNWYAFYKEITTVIKATKNVLMKATNCPNSVKLYCVCFIFSSSNLFWPIFVDFILCNRNYISVLQGLQ